MKKLLLFAFFAIAIPNISSAQEMDRASLDSLKYAIINLQEEVQVIETNLYRSKKTLKTGVFIATLGYTVTIIGGQLLGTKPELGEALLYTGGAIGITGTVILVKGFNKISLGPPKRD